MDSSYISPIGSGINLSKIEPIEQKRTVAFINHFLSRTIQFLNNFARVCELRLGDLHSRLGKLETSLVILETKLLSIPGLENITINDISSGGVPAVQDTGFPAVQVQSQSSPHNIQESEVVTVQASAEIRAQPDELQDNLPTVSQDPRYAKYLKMIQVGVPIQALKPKLLAEGLDPNLLETPDAPLAASLVVQSHPETKNYSDSDDASEISD